MSGLAWWTIAGVALVGWAPGFALKEGTRRPGCDTDDEEMLVDTASDTESVLTLTPDEPIESVLRK